MGHLFNRNVLLGVTGGIAAYKSAQLVRDLQTLGASVKVVMTHGATQFITPLTLQALSGQPVHEQLLDAEAEAGMGHIELARWADLVLVAPATADFISRLAHGRADDLLTTLCLATSAPLLIAPAMNQAMWRDQATSANMTLLKERHIRVIGPADGTQACGDVGPGRMEEPRLIAEVAASVFPNSLLQGVHVTITAGPTREAIDPVRYISNHSSGKMGYAIAAAAVDAGAVTTLISGPVALEPPDRVRFVAVESAEQMHAAALEDIASCDVFIACAAVSDYRPAAVAADKIKKDASTLQLELVRNPDIVAAVAAHPQRPFTVGFAAETRNVEEYATGKLQKKNLDMIVANDVGAEQGGFGSDDNAATILWHEGSRKVPLTSKAQLASLLIETIATHYGASTTDKQ
jgi:phosphopantothenoylcysteine decarboxylase/phosphopantothenate--cysteine ligase